MGGARRYDTGSNEAISGIVVSGGRVFVTLGGWFGDAASGVVSLPALP